MFMYACNFPSFDYRGNLAALLQHCLATLVHNKNAVMELPMHHFVRQNIEIFRDAYTLDRFLEDVHVSYPWDDENNQDNGVSFGSGIPPHISLLVSQQVAI